MIPWGGSLGPRGYSTVLPVHIPSSYWRHKILGTALDMQVAYAVVILHNFSSTLGTDYANLLESRKLSVQVEPTPWPAGVVYYYS